MSTTVTYKGATLTTVDNDTVTLETAGKYCEDDFTLTDVSGGGGGGITTVTINGWAAAAKLYYLDGTMTVNNTTSNPSPISCLSKSLLVLFRGLPEPGNPAPTYSNATLVVSISLGNRANYNYADIVQVD